MGKAEVIYGLSLVSIHALASETYKTKVQREIKIENKLEVEMDRGTRIEQGARKKL